MRFSVDTGGTFTDLVIEDNAGQLWMYKSPTTPHDPVVGILDVLELAARELDTDRAALLAQGDVFIHATTRAINAILTHQTARTAFLTTAGHPDILLIREGGRERFNLGDAYPEPYIPRSATFQVPERIGSRGEIVKPLDEARVLEIIETLREREFEAVAVCLLWSIVNPAHELRVGELLAQHLPGVPFTLSHRLNPTLREYRRASSAAIDASLKPVMTQYIQSLETRLQEAGFAGRLLMVTSSGGVLDTNVVAEAPIHLLKSGPSVAPIAGRHFAMLDADADTSVVADTGGTSYDVGLVRRGTIPWTRETWLGPEFTGHMTGFPSIDVKSIGAGGGSIAWMDEGGLLHVGPQSAGAVPGPVCYGRGGTLPTVTDAALVLGYLDPAYFLGGKMPLQTEQARQAIQAHVAERLGMTVEDAAAAIMQIVTENMVQLIEEISLNQGVDPREAVLVGGGGAAGMNSVAIARRLGSSRLIIPETGAVLSAVGALLSDLTSDYEATFMTSSPRFTFDRVNEVLARLEKECQAFIDGPGAHSLSSAVELSAAIRYPSEIWEVQVPLRVNRFTSQAEVEQVRQDFHLAHQQLFGTSDPRSPIDIVSWRGRARCRYRGELISRPRSFAVDAPLPTTRPLYFAGTGKVDAQVYHFESLPPGERVCGPAIVESPVTTVVIDPGAVAERRESGSLVIFPTGAPDVSALKQEAGAQ